MDTQDKGNSPVRQGRWRLEREEYALIALAISVDLVDLLVHVRGHSSPTSVETVILALLTGIAGFLGGFAGKINALRDSVKDVPDRVKEIAEIVTKESKLMEYDPGGQFVQYGKAKSLLDAPERSEEIFLMQQSSTLILGPDSKSAAEKDFYATLKNKIKERGTTFYPVVSLEGIARHLESGKGKFTGKLDAWKELRQDKEGIFIPGDRKAKHYIKRIHDSREGVKPDKQARVLLIGRPENTADALMVLDVGGKQSYFHLRGPDMRRFLNDCVWFYNNDCDPLTVQELKEKVPNLEIRDEDIEKDLDA
jgi:hypothetical protein